MGTITREELDLANQAVENLGYSTNEATQLIIEVLTAVAPEKLMTPFEIEQVIRSCTHGRTVEDYYNFHRLEAAIELQIPELWELHQRKLQLAEDMKKAVELLCIPPIAENF